MEHGARGKLANPRSGRGSPAKREGKEWRDTRYEGLNIEQGILI